MKRRTVAPVMRAPASVALGLALALMALFPGTALGVASGHFCSDTSNVKIISTPVGTFYYDDRPTAGVRDFPPVSNGMIKGEGTWIYEETNGIPGLQRGGHGITTAPRLDPLGLAERDDVEICVGGDSPDGHGYVDHDQLIY